LYSAISGIERTTPSASVIELKKPPTGAARAICSMLEP